jgi:putative glutamine amidotransferase
MPLSLAVSNIQPNYAAWLLRGDPSLALVDLSTASDPLKALAACDALLLTGGEDVQPSLYGHPEYEALCEKMDPQRDALESLAINAALERKMPVLAICRGEQIINAVLGGTLVADLYAQNRITTVHTKNRETKVDARHPIDVEPGTLLHKIAGVLHGEINSAHHQAVDTVAPDLRVSATAPDGTAEAIEWRDPMGRGYLLGVQWHPERMEFESPFSQHILHHYLFEAESFARLHARAGHPGEAIN